MIIRARRSFTDYHTIVQKVHINICNGSKITTVYKNAAYVIQIPLPASVLIDTENAYWTWLNGHNSHIGSGWEVTLYEYETVEIAQNVNKLTWNLPHELASLMIFWVSELSMSGLKRLSSVRTSSLEMSPSASTSSSWNASRIATHNYNQHNTVCSFIFSYTHLYNEKKRQKVLK